MFRVDGEGVSESLPTPAADGDVTGYFRDGNPSLGEQGTQVTADWLNAVQEELLSVIQYAGITPDKDTHTQLLSALKLMAGEVSTSVQTTNGSAAVAHSIAVAQGEAFTVEAMIVGRKSDGTAFGHWKLFGGFYRNSGGNVTQNDVTSIPTSIVPSGEGTTTWLVDLVVNTGTQSIDIQVTGKAATTINWHVSVRTIKTT